MSCIPISTIYFTKNPWNFVYKREQIFVVDNNVLLNIHLPKSTTLLVVFVLTKKYTKLRQLDPNQLC